MNGIVAIFVLMCLLGMVATIPIAFGWMRKWGLAGAKDAFMVGGASFCALIVVAAFSGPPESRIKETTGARSAPSQVVAAPQAKQRPTLDKIRIGNVLWEKDGFGTVMVATFRIDNDNTVRIKDVQVTCRHYSNSGTNIDSNTRTVFEFIEPRSYHYVHNMNMGFIHSAATKTNCRATNFVG